MLAAAAIASLFFSLAVWCFLGLQLPLVPAFLPGTGSYPGQHCESCFAGCFLALPLPVELGLSECLSVQACPCFVFEPVLCALGEELDFDALFLLELFLAELFLLAGLFLLAELFFAVELFLLAAFFDGDFFVADFFVELSLADDFFAVAILCKLPVCRRLSPHRETILMPAFGRSRKRMAPFAVDASTT